MVLGHPHIPCPCETVNVGEIPDGAHPEAGVDNPSAIFDNRVIVTLDVVHNAAISEIPVVTICLGRDAFGGKDGAVSLQAILVPGSGGARVDFACARNVSG